MKLKIIFVDDEPLILNGIKRLLRSKRNEWEIFYANSGEIALKYFSENDIDVLVTDMKMPKMDGVELLKKVSDLYPQTIRLVLTGHSDQNMIFDSINTAHQYLMKPCTSEEIINRIQKVSELKNLLVDDSLRTIINSAKKLPALPENFIKLEKELSNPQTSIKKISKIIERDPVMSAKILQLVNSAFFTLTQTVSDIGAAINLLGIDTIKALVLYSEVFKVSEEFKSKLINLKSLWSHSLIVANLSKEFAKKISADLTVLKQAYITGLLHDIGYLILNQLKNYDENILKIMEEKNISRHHAEIEWLGISHSEIGAYLLGVWNLPNHVVNGVAYHYKNDLNEYSACNEDILALVHYFLRDKEYLMNLANNSSKKELILEHIAIIEELYQNISQNVEESHD